MTGEDAEYHRNHRRVKREYGRASNYKCIDGCGKQALDWSHRHGTDPAEPKNYEPRCRSCHNKYDETPEKAARRRVIQQAAWTEERKKSMIGNKRSAGHINNPNRDSEGRYASKCES